MVVCLGRAWKRKWPVASVVAVAVLLNFAPGSGEDDLRVTCTPPFREPVTCPAIVVARPAVSVVGDAVIDTAFRPPAPAVVVVNIMSEPFEAPDALLATRRKW